MININYYLTDIKFNQKSKSEKIYSDPNIKIEPKDCKYCPAFNVSTAQTQTQSKLLEIFSNHIDNSPWRFLDKKDLANCLMTCKQVNHLANPFFVKNSLSTINEDFKRLEEKFNSSLADYDIYDESICKKIASFKDHFIFLLSKIAKDIKDPSEISEETSKLLEISTSVIKLNKYCNSLKKPNYNEFLNDIINQTLNFKIR